MAFPLGLPTPPVFFAVSLMPALYTMALSASFLRSYVTTNKHGQKTNMFVYRVTGTPAELSAFEEAQGEYYRTEPDGTPVYISPKGYGKEASLLVLPATEDRPARVVADNSDIAMAISMMEQYKGTAVYDAIAQQIAVRMFATAPPAAPAPAPPTEG
jgi:hypothetical protein